MILKTATRHAGEASYDVAANKASDSHASEPNEGRQLICSYCKRSERLLPREDAATAVSYRAVAAAPNCKRGERLLSREDVATAVCCRAVAAAPNCKRARAEDHLRPP